MGYKETNKYFEICIIESYNNNEQKYHSYTQMNYDISEYVFVPISSIINSIQSDNNYVRLDDLFKYYYDHCIVNQSSEINHMKM